MKREIIDAGISAGICGLAIAITFILLVIVGFACQVAEIPLPMHFLPIAVLVSLATPWFAIRVAQSHYKFAVPYPMNAFGGVMIGLALIWWWMMGLAMAAEFLKHASVGAWLIGLVVPMLAIGIVVIVSGSLAALVNFNIAIPLLVASPFVAIASMLLVMIFGGT